MLKIRWGVEVRAGALEVSLRLIGLLYVLDFVQRWPWRRLLYTDDGILPSAWLGGAEPVWGWADILKWPFVGSVELVLIVGAVCGVLLALGIQSRKIVAGLLLSIFVLRERNPIYAIGADLCAISFLIFVLFTRATERPGRVISYCFGGLLGVIYGVASWKKWNDSWLTTGTAIELSVRSAFPKNHWVWDWFGGPWAPWATRGIFFLEAMVPIIFFLPFFGQRVVRLLVLLFVGIHAITWIFLPLGIFPWLMVALWVPFLPIGDPGSAPKPSVDRKLREVVLVVILMTTVLFGIEELTKRSYAFGMLKSWGEISRLKSPWSFYSEMSEWRAQIRIVGKRGNITDVITDTEENISSDVLPPLSNARWERSVLAFSQNHSAYAVPGLLNYLCNQNSSYEWVRADLVYHPIPGISESKVSTLPIHRISRVFCKNGPSNE